LRNPLFGREVAKQSLLLKIFTAHRGRLLKVERFRRSIDHLAI
jgi:hypothetical protein